MNKTVISGCLIGLSLLAGCSHPLVISTPAEVRDPKDSRKRINSNEAGLAYSLPMGQVYLQATRSKVTDDAKKKDAAGDATTSGTTTTIKTTKTSTTTTTDNKETVETKQVKETGKSGTKPADSAKQGSQAATQATGQPEKEKWSETVTLTVLPVAPDPSARYIAALDHGFSRDDTMNISAPKGLLTTTTVTSVDRTPEVIVTLADTIITAAYGGGSGMVPFVKTDKPNEQKPQPPACAPFTYAKIFDPFDGQAVEQIRGALQSAGASFRVNVGRGATDTPLGNREDKNANLEIVEGLAYRAMTPIAISVVNAPAEDLKADCNLANSPIQAWQIFVPDTTTHYHVSSQAGAFTTTSLTYGFTDGILTQYNVIQPSEIAAIAGVPIRIANSIMTIPTSILKMRVDYDTQAVARINGDANVKAAQIKQAGTIADAEAAVVTAQTALSKARIGDETSMAKAQLELENAKDQLRAARVTAASNAAAAPAP